MAYLRKIPQILCKCGKRATRTLYDRWHGPGGDHCRACGSRELNRLQAAENDEDVRESDAALVFVIAVAREAEIGRKRAKEPTV